MNPLDSAVPVPPQANPVTAPLPNPAAAGTNRALADAKLHKVAKQFEAVFMTEMLRMARPQDDKSAKGFSTGESGSTWKVFMDQALGEAATANGGTGLARQIEAALRRAQGGKK